jgi:hypothetical protein
VTADHEAVMLRQLFDKQFNIWLDEGRVSEADRNPAWVFWRHGAAAWSAINVKESTNA